MKKKYETPVMTVTKWISEDIITTSGMTASNTTLTVDTADEGIKSVSFTNIE